ncbi:hypothetical protein B0H63DRAFT_183313 [Podospora didyma]|uniref:Uncharacterized protein n=1 Tax=Podospora didyma TaxID=330526 RepID=A0AAE0NQ37_9PEZI|nr:hypothetical protein B0H63DRAFT_183313 [Podospora didyma]
MLPITAHGWRPHRWGAERRRRIGGLNSTRQDSDWPRRSFQRAGKRPDISKVTGGLASPDLCLEVGTGFNLGMVSVAPNGVGSSPAFGHRRQFHLPVSRNQLNAPGDQGVFAQGQVPCATCPLGAVVNWEGLGFAVLPRFPTLTSESRGSPWQRRTKSPWNKSPSRQRLTGWRVVGIEMRCARSGKPVSVAGGSETRPTCHQASKLGQPTYSARREAVEGIMSSHF